MARLNDELRRKLGIMQNKIIRTVEEIVKREVGELKEKIPTEEKIQKIARDIARDESFKMIQPVLVELENIKVKVHQMQTQAKIDDPYLWAEKRFPEKDYLLAKGMEHLERIAEGGEVVVVDLSPWSTKKFVYSPYERTVRKYEVFPESLINDLTKYLVKYSDRIVQQAKKNPPFVGVKDEDIGELPEELHNLMVSGKFEDVANHLINYILEHANKDPPLSWRWALLGLVNPIIGCFEYNKGPLWRLMVVLDKFMIFKRRTIETGRGLPSASY